MQRVWNTVKGMCIPSDDYESMNTVFNIGSNDMQLELFLEHFNYPNVTPIYYYWEELPLKLYEELEEIERVHLY